MLEKLSHWIQIVSGVVLIVGVVLVVVQMQQNERLTEAQLASDWFTQRASHAAMAAGENPMKSFAKLCNPDAVVMEEDAFVLHQLFLQRLYMSLYGRGVSRYLDSDGDGWERVLQRNMALVVSTPQGRAWFESMDLTEAVVDVVRGSPFYDSDCSSQTPPVALINADRELKATTRD